MATVQKRGNSYRIRVSCGYDINYNQIVKSHTWKPEAGMTQKQIEKELERQIVLFEQKVKSGQHLDGNVKFCDFADKWFDEYASVHLAPRTVARYKTLYERINKALGHLKISMVQPHHLMAFYKNLAEDGINLKTGKGLSPKTINHHHRLISSIMSTAVTWQVIDSNPCERVKPPKVEPKEAKYLDEDDLKRLLKLLETEEIKYQTAIMLFIDTGMRRAEACGLEWSDIDFTKGTINIVRNSLYLSSKGIYEGKTKTESSKRTIAVSKNVLALLKKYKRWYDSERLKLGDLWEGEGRVFIQWNGKPIHPDTFTQWFHDFVEKHNLPEVSIHSLRHTSATMLIANGVPLRNVSERLGHAKMSTTSDIYTHAVKTWDEKAANIIDEILDSNNNAGL